LDRLSDQCGDARVSQEGYGVGDLLGASDPADGNAFRVLLVDLGER
jgi:hypothetical protein